LLFDGIKLSSRENDPTPIREVTINVASRTQPQGDPKIIRPAFARYVSRNKGFLTHVGDVRNQIITYLSKVAVKRPLNILLAAPPGSGKSFLIKELISSTIIKTSAQENPLSELSSFEETYIASLENVDELFKIFQRIQSINLEGKIPVVFFDEIDARIADTSHVYAKFLAPMWDGTFFLGKEKFFLGKCILFFAGSGLSLEEQSRDVIARLAKKDELVSYDSYYDAWKQEFDEHFADSEQKLPDFLDRIDAVLRIPPICKELLGSETDDEYDELACMLIRKHFPAVRFIEKEALTIIRQALKTESSVRNAEKIVFSSKSKAEEGFEWFDIECLPRRHQKSSARTGDLADKKWWDVKVEKPSAG
jgi:ATPase family associated with various cellular activities (AAA)